MYNAHQEHIDCVIHEATRDDALVIIGHGLTGHKDRDLYVHLAESLSDLGWPCLRFSFSGHGKSEGKFTEMTISKEVSDLQSLLDQYKGSKKIAYIGHSMGAAVGALTVAKEDRISTLISLAGMVNTKAFYDQEFGELIPDQDSMWDESDFPLSCVFQSDLYQIDSIISAVRDIKIPWLMLHGEADDVVLPNHSTELYHSIKGKKKLVPIPNCDHQFSDHYSTITEEIAEWLTRYLK